MSFGITMEALGAAVVVAAFFENPAVLLRYQIKAPPPRTATKVNMISRRARQDFMGFF